MYKSLSLMLLFLCFCKAAAFSAPAYPKARKVVQPDGTTITIIGHGNEYFHYLTTEDGTVVAKGEDGFYRPTGEEAKAMAPKKANALRQMNYDDMPVRQSFAGKPYKGLVILVNFNDRQFSRGNEQAHTFYDKMMNMEGFSTDYDKYYGKQNYTGSMRDYFYDNSYGQFVPEFDVIGPIDIDRSQYYINGVENTYKLMKEILAQVDDEVDYTKYDSDGDGVMDMVYVIYAGYASHYQDNDERLIWPHAGSMGDEYGDATPVHDGIKMGRFAASAEIFGWHDDGDLVLDGIGVIVHEFSHVLGFMDHYDTSGGWQEHPNYWDIMSAGCYSDDINRTPCGFNSFEKHAAGFNEPLDITDMAGEHITMQATETSTDACMIRSLQNHVSYFMENRQADKWDKNLPGHGMLVWRVDSIRPEYWQYNYINVTTRACFRLVRACGTQGSWMTGVEDVDYDPFPGTHNISELDNDDDDANLISYDGYPCPVVLRQIAENNGVISFDVEADPDAENRPITYAFPDKLYAKAEKLVGEEWVPVEWTLKKKTVGEEEVLSNFLPDTENYDIRFMYMEDADHTVMINAQRLEKNNDFSRWMCNLSSVEEQGAGALTFTVNRYGVPSIDSELHIGICTMKPTAYVVSKKNIIDIEAVYRNIQFDDDPFDPSGINTIDTKTSLYKNRKFIVNGRIVIENNGKFYNVAGMEL